MSYRFFQTLLYYRRTFKDSLYFIFIVTIFSITQAAESIKGVIIAFPQKITPPTPLHPF